jgi:hypothetical protein
MRAEDSYELQKRLDRVCIKLLEKAMKQATMPPPWHIKIWDAEQRLLRDWLCDLGHPSGLLNAPIKQEEVSPFARFDYDAELTATANDKKLVLKVDAAGVWAKED